MPNGGRAHISPTGRLPLPTLLADSLFDSVLIPSALSDGKVEQALSTLHPPPPGGYAVKCVVVRVSG